MEGYNRYGKLSSDGIAKLMPGIKIPVKDSDESIIWNSQTHRLDDLSYKYYGIATEGWLIKMANLEYGTDEFDYPDGALIRIPYPYTSSLQSFIDALNRYDNQFGL